MSPHQIITIKKSNWPGQILDFFCAPMRKTAIALLFTLTACAPNPEKVQRVANEEASRLTPPSKALSTFANFELQPLRLAEAIEVDEDKREEAQELEENLRAKITPLLQQWTENNVDGQGTLIIEPVLLKLRIVGGGTRFFAGLYTGSSFIDMDLNLVGGASGESIGSARIHRNAGPVAGAFSIGKSDQNLDEYVVSIIYKYLSEHY